MELNYASIFLVLVLSEVFFGKRLNLALNTQHLILSNLAEVLLLACAVICVNQPK